MIKKNFYTNVALVSLMFSLKICHFHGLAHWASFYPQKMFPKTFRTVKMDFQRILFGFPMGNIFKVTKTDTNTMFIGRCTNVFTEDIWKVFSHSGVKIRKIQIKVAVFLWSIQAKRFWFELWSTSQETITYSRST